MFIATGFHLFPSRTEKLSPLAPMVLQKCGRVGRRQPLKDRNSSEFLSFFFALNFTGLRFLSGVEGIPLGVRLFFFAQDFCGDEIGLRRIVVPADLAEVDCGDWFDWISYPAMEGIEGISAKANC